MICCVLVARGSTGCKLVGDVDYIMASEIEPENEERKVFFSEMGGVSRKTKTHYEIAT
jgi:hypothetical protein